MKKLLFVLAFAFFAAFSYAAYVSVNTNTIIVEKLEDEPKKEKAKAEESSEDKAEATKTDKKEGCSKEKTSCAKTCGGK
jgi:hypothetical protein